MVSEFQYLINAETVAFIHEKIITDTTVYTVFNYRRVNSVNSLA